MERNPGRMAERGHDLLVIGGGITGACLAWDATLRGLSVALVEKGDFGEATSAASSKLIHGGIRYLQQGLLGKVRESLEERRRFLRIAPHLLRPVPFLVPTYGHGMKGKEVLAAGMAAYGVVGLGVNRGLPPERHVEGARMLSREEVLRLEPLVRPEGLTGGAVFPEIHMHTSERMTLGVVTGAAERGAEVANRVEVTGFLGDDRCVTGVRALDHVSGDPLEIRAKLTVNASGPWAYGLLERLGGGRAAPGKMRHSKGCHLVLPNLTNGRALALATLQENESIVNRGGRHIFLIPWRDRTLIGTTNVPFHGEPDELAVTASDIDDFLVEIRTAIPAATLRREDVAHAFAGLYPLVDTDVREDVYQGTGEYRLRDHREADGVDGLLTVLGAKFTTALRLAEKAVDRVFARDRRCAPPCRTSSVPLPGGEFGSAEEIAHAVRETAPALGEAEAAELTATHGSRAVDIARRIGDDPALAERVSPDRPTVAAAVVEAVENEMALSLADVVFRRTGLGTIGHPGGDCLQRCAQILGGELGWDRKRIEGEVHEVDRRLTIPQ